MYLPRLSGAGSSSTVPIEAAAAAARQGIIVIGDCRWVCRCSPFFGCSCDLYCRGPIIIIADW